MAQKKSKLKKKNYPTLTLKTPRDISYDFAEKVVKKFDKLVKAVVLFGSTAKNETKPGSDIDIIIIVDDATIKFDEKFIVWYREELGKIISANPYKKDLHINTVKVTTWFEDLIRSDPVVVNIIRYGEVLFDVGGFFLPLKILLQQGKLMPTPESIYTILNRIPSHILRSRMAEMSAVEGCYWAYVESAQALLMAVKILPPSPEHIPELLEEHFTKKGFLKKQHIKDFKEVHNLHKMILHGQIKNIDGKIIDQMQEKSENFFKISVNLLNEIL